MMIRLGVMRFSRSALLAVAWLASSWARSGRNPGHPGAVGAFTGAGIGRFVGGGLGTAVGTQLGSNVMGGLYDAVTGSSERDPSRLPSRFGIRRNCRKSVLRPWPRDEHAGQNA